MSIAIEELGRKRQPYPSMEAIYFVSATDVALSKIIEDFTGTRPKYAGAHIYFVSSMPLKKHQN